jgi:3-(3-hydroxy-phenyl)propionate hydroxylase
MASPDFDVCIIGYGPVGASLANLLGLSGLRTVVLEREPSVYHLPRAVALDGEGMRLVQTMQLADEMLPRLNVSRNIRHVSADGKLLLLISPRSLLELSVPAGVP